MRTLLAAALLASLTPAHGMTRDYRVPDECAALAMRANIPVVLSRREAKLAVYKLQQYLMWPGVKECRNAAKRDWGM